MKGKFFGYEIAELNELKRRLVFNKVEKNCNTCDYQWRGQDNFATPCQLYPGEKYKQERQECIENNYNNWKSYIK